MENSIRDRVSEVLKYLGLNVNRASKYLGVPQRTLNRQVNEGGNISMEIVNAILNNVPEISPAWLIAGDGPMLLGDIAPKAPGLPFYDDLPLSAGLRDSFDPANEKPSAYISIPTSPADFYFPVSGSSMEPEFNDGDIVGVKRVDCTEGIVHGAVYMVVTNENRMIKRCYHDNNDPNLIWCVSPNYPSFPINKNDVCALFKVVSRIETF
ncbi:MAG: LexA family transcriptional regulator [Bacteroidaceae bacterium]|nr:LexA family transcriptional regulator [Bacteroidaceae bacterium]